MQDTSLKSEGRSYAKSSSFVMALLFTVLCGAAAICLGYFINYFAKGHFVHSTEAVLDSEIRYIESIDGISDITSNKDRLYIFLNEDGNLPDSFPQEISRLAEGIIVFDHPQNNNRYAAKIHTFEDGRKLLIGFDITQISQDFQFMQWLGIASIGFVMVVVLVSYLISIFVVSGTNKIADTAREIMETGDLSRRVELGSRWDDLSNMAAVLNTLLGRIEELMKGVRQVSDNIAHDLRTPLTRMRNKIEALQKKYGHDDYSELMEEADQLLSTFNALLRISRIEAEKQKSQFQQVDIKVLISDVIDFYEPLAEEKSIKLSADLSESSCYGDRDLLFQAYANLLDNALKFTPKSGDVDVLLYHKGKRVCVEIKDTGPGVPEDKKMKIFDRFYRGEKSRSSSGTGLGLSLVSAVINLHGGTIHVENMEPGLKIITTL